MCYVYRVTCLMVLVTCRMLIFSFLQSGEVSLLRVCYQQGLSCLVLRLFFFYQQRVDTQYLPLDL